MFLSVSDLPILFLYLLRFTFLSFSPINLFPFIFSIICLLSSLSSHFSPNYSDVPSPFQSLPIVNVFLFILLFHSPCPQDLFNPTSSTALYILPTEHFPSFIPPTLSILFSLFSFSVSFPS
jgi:hypothetical protein